MKPLIEFILPMSHPAVDVSETIPSLLAQTDRRFSVLISDNFAEQSGAVVNRAVELLAAGGIAVRRMKPPAPMSLIEHWNWTHAQSEADWLKPLLPGDKLMPHFVEKVLQRAALNKPAKLIQCDYVIQFHTDGVSNPVVFNSTSLTAAEFFEVFARQGNCIGGPLNVCYRRDAFFAAGGLGVHLSYYAHYNLHLRLCLESGVEIIPEMLVSTRARGGFPAGRFNRWIERWLVLRQAEIYCKNAKLPWPKSGVRRFFFRHGRNNEEVSRLPFQFCLLPK
jgi:hypothetical protein